MTGPANPAETTADHHRFETELLAQDRDMTRRSTADVDEPTAKHLVSALIEAEVVIPVADECVFVHEPSNMAFDSIRQLAAFHRGWLAARNATEANA